MNVTPTTGEKITIEEARTLTQAYENAHINATLAGVIGKNHIQNILNQDNCVGLRVYLALKEDGMITFVFVGSDANGQNITLNGEIYDRNTLCPSKCPSKL